MQLVGSGLIVGNRYFLCGRKGELQCGDIHKGEIISAKDLREQNWGAIRLVGEYLYLTDQSPVTRVFAPPDHFELRYENTMEPGERSNAAIGFNGGRDLSADP